MKYGLNIRPEVAAQILSPSSYLDGTQEGLGEQLEQELEKLLTFITENPLMYPREFGPVRRAVLKRFKQIVFYTVEGETVILLEFRDARREPPDWAAKGFRDN